MCERERGGCTNQVDCGVYRQTNLKARKKSPLMLEINLILKHLIIMILNVFLCLGIGHIASQYPNKRFFYFI